MSPSGRLALVLRALGDAPQAAAAAALLTVLVGGAVLAPWLVRTNPYDLAALDLLDSHLPPAFLAGGDARYLLGTDSQGADLLSLILYGLRASLVVGLLAVALSAALGTAAGLVSGYLGGWAESVLMRLADIQFTFPALLLALLIGGISQKLLSDAIRATMAMPILVLALGIAHWPHFARLVRGAVLVEREKDYIAAARLVGRRPAAIMLAQLLPNVMNPIVVLATLDVAFAIMSEATLSFLGFGMPSSRPSLGTLIRIGYGYVLSGEWWVVLFPGMALVMTLVSVNLIGDWLRDWLDPKLR